MNGQLDITAICLTILISIGIGVLLKSLYNIREILKFSKTVKGSRFYPIVGNGHHFILSDIFTILQNSAAKYGFPFGIWACHDYYYNTTDPNEIKIILNDPNSFDKLKIYDCFNFCCLDFKKTLIAAPVGLWKKNRKNYSRSFSQHMLNSYVPSFYKNSCSLLETLKKNPQADLFELFEGYTVDSFGESIMGCYLNVQASEGATVMEYIREFQAIIGKRFLTRQFFYPDIIWTWMYEGSRAEKGIWAVRNAIRNIIRQKKKEYEHNAGFIENKTFNLLDILFESREFNYVEEEIVDEILLFWMAAMDTSGHTLAFTHLLLGMHPQIQEQVYQEVISVVGPERPIYHDDLPNLKYTERAIQEALRVFPVFPFFGRRATAHLDLGTKIIPKGTNIMICALNVHRDPKYWPEPLKYDPDRFLPEELQKRDPYTYIPFAKGPRHCIGKTYAMMLMKIAVANVVRNFRIKSNYKSIEELELTSGVTLRTKDDLQCNFIPRNLE